MLCSSSLILQILKLSWILKVSYNEWCRTYNSRRNDPVIGHPKSATAPLSSNLGSLLKNWHEPHKAIGMDCTRALLCNISASSDVEVHFNMISWVGFWKRSWLIIYVTHTLGFLPMFTIHRRMGLVTWFNPMFKNMIHNFIHDDAFDWDKWLKPLLFAVWEAMQTSTGFSPFELL